MTTYYAQPHDISAQGFFFEDAKNYRLKIAHVTNAYGKPVEELEIQFIDGDELDAELAQAVGLCQYNIEAFIEAAEYWDEDDKLHVIIAAGECGCPFDITKDEPQEWQIDIYPDTDLKELALDFLNEGLFGDVPDSLQCYIDHDAIARDLAIDYTETVIAGQRMVYRCA